MYPARLARSSLVSLLLGLAGSASAGAGCSSASSGSSPGNAGDAGPSGTCAGYPQSFVASCQVTASGVDECDEYTGAWTTASVQKDCVSDSTFTDTYSTQPCSTTNVVGRCVHGCGDPSQIVGFEYAGTPVPTSQIESDCTRSGGSWLPGASGGGQDAGGAGDAAMGGDSGCAAMPDPITGTWKITDITCAGAPAPATVQSVYTAPNSAEYVFTSSTSGSQVSGTAGSAGSCTLTIPLSFSYPSAGNLVVMSGGAITCSPASCSPACGTSMTVTPPPSYGYVVSDCNTLVLTSTNMNDVCANPVVYTLQRQ